jgi:Tfp pilus assembly protein PilO
VSARLNEWLERLGAAGVVALGLLCFDAALFFSGVLPARERALAAESRLRAGAARLPATRSGAPRDPLARLLAVFPPQAAIPDELERLFRIAGEQQLQLLQGDYRLEQQAELLKVYRISLPLKGSYAQVRAFVAAALNAMPYLSLDSIRFERQRVGDASVETRVKFSLFLSTPGRTSAGEAAAR